ncbi:hypothetical protein ACI2KR_28025 [Pseudomonas luteola]
MWAGEQGKDFAVIADEMCWPNVHRP